MNFTNRHTQEKRGTPSSTRGNSEPQACGSTPPYPHTTLICYMQLCCLFQSNKIFLKC